jgi:hypothetical protein
MVKAEVPAIPAPTENIVLPSLAFTSKPEAVEFQSFAGFDHLWL